MKVLMVTPSYYPIIGGSEALTRNLSTKLNEVGIHTDIMTFNMDKKWYPVWKEEIKKDGSSSVYRMAAFNPFIGVPNYFHPFFKINILPKPSFVRKFRDYDIIHFIGEADLGFPIFSRFIKRPKIMSCVGIFKRGIYKYYVIDRPFIGSVFKKFFSNLADIYIVYSDEEKNIISELGVPEKKVQLLPLGVDVNVFQADKTKKIDNLLLFVGRIDRIKGLHVLIKALSYLKIPTQLAIIGPRWDEEYVKEIEKMADVINKKCVHKIELLGSMDQSDIIPWYQRATVLVCPYLVETHSYVMLEALACETPVVSTGTHILKQGSDGIFVTQKDPRSLANGIKKMLENSRMRESYGKEGRTLVVREFSWESVVKRLAKIYENMFS